MVKKLRLFCILVSLPAGLLADFSYEQSAKMTGGAMMGAMKIVGAFSKQAREPIATTVSVKGNRMVHGSKEHAQIIDLDSETITDVNFAKKQYSVITFAEMTQAMEQGRGDQLAGTATGELPRRQPEQDQEGGERAEDVLTSQRSRVQPVEEIDGPAGQAEHQPGALEPQGNHRDIQEPVDRPVDAQPGDNAHVAAGGNNGAGVDPSDRMFLEEMHEIAANLVASNKRSVLEGW